MTNGIIDSDQKIVTNGLVLHLDAAQKRSYSGTGTTWTDLSGNSNNGTLTNGPTFNSANGGSIQFDGVNDYINSNNISNVRTQSYWVKLNNNRNLNLASCLGENFYINGVLTSVLGGELVTNGNFNTDLSGWQTNGGQSTLSWVNDVSGNGSTGYMRFNIISNTDYDRFFQSVNTVANQPYLISFWYRTSGVTGAAFRIYLNSNNASLTDSVVSRNIEPNTNWTFFSLIMQTTNLSFPIFTISKIGQIGAGTLDIDAISIKPLTTSLFTVGRWVNLVTTSSQPLYKSDYFGFTGASAQAFFNGEISNVIKYNRVLSDAEVLQNYNATKARFEVPALLDLYPNAAAAYSLRKLRSGYTGSAIRVRRSSDNTEQDIGFTSTGDLDTTALTTFVGANNGFVTTWYDQSGNNRNATQTTQANQPIVVSGGTTITENNKPVIYANNRTKRMNIPSFTLVGDYSIVIASTLKSFGRNMWMGTLGLSGYVRALDTQTQGFSIRHNGEVGGANFSGVQSLRPELHVFQRFGTNISYSRNSVNNITTELSPQGTNFTISVLFDGYNDGIGYLMDANAFEFIIYNSNQSANRINIETNINSYYGIYNSNIDSDAQSFITAATITDSTQQGAVDALVKDLKNYGLWTKMKAIYPFVGGTANSHKFNLKDPRDVDGAFRLSFVNAWTHASTGALPNSTNGYADTFLNLQNNFTGFNNHFSFYYRTTSATGSVLDGKVGAAASNYENGMSVHAGRGSVFNDNMGRVQATNAYYGNMRAFHCSTLTSQTSMKFFRNMELISSGVANAASTYPNLNFYFGAVNSAGTATFFQPLELIFGSIGIGLTDTEVRNLYTAVQKYQTTLGRQV